MTASSPVELARAALRIIVDARLSPTPEEFTRRYHEAAGTAPPIARASEQQSSSLDAAMVEQLDSLAGRLIFTSDDLASGLDQRSAQMDASLELLVADNPATDTVELLQAIVATAKDMHLVLKASYTELINTRNHLAEIKGELAESRKLLEQDALTGTDNRRAMEAILVRELAHARRDGQPLSVTMIDLDHFKRINDTHGHAAGDAALVHLTRLAKSMLRGHDAFARYGGEEFVLVLPETALQGAVYVTGRLQALLHKTPLIFADKTIAMAFSAGVATLNADDSEGSLLRRADAALYEAKRSGRNRVVVGE